MMAGCFVLMQRQDVSDPGSLTDPDYQQVVLNSQNLLGGNPQALAALSWVVSVRMRVWRHAGKFLETALQASSDTMLSMHRTAAARHRTFGLAACRASAWLWRATRCC